MLPSQVLGSTDQHVFLVGRPPMGEYLSFVKVQSVGGDAIDDRILGDEWRNANDRVRQLEAEEAGFADSPPLGPLPPEAQPFRNQLLDDPVFQRSFRIVPADVVMVELDRLVVFQKFINLTFIQQLRSTLSASPSTEELFRFCLLGGHPQPEVQVGRIAQNAFIFTSPSTDVRFLDVALLQAGQIGNYVPHGRLAAAAGLMVGYGSNLLNAIHVEGRLVLNNGSHRAYALREAGLAYAPCLVQTLSRREELEVVASGEFQQNPDRYLKTPRPSVLKDYFDPQLRKIASVARKVRQVKVSFGVEVLDVPAS